MTNQKYLFIYFLKGLMLKKKHLLEFQTEPKLDYTQMYHRLPYTFKGDKLGCAQHETSCDLMHNHFPLLYGSEEFSCPVCSR